LSFDSMLQDTSLSLLEDKQSREGRTVMSPICRVFTEGFQIFNLKFTSKLSKLSRPRSSSRP